GWKLQRSPLGSRGRRLPVLRHLGCRPSVSPLGSPAGGNSSEAFTIAAYPYYCFISPVGWIARQATGRHPSPFGILLGSPAGGNSSKAR
ncbi:hypothetical protein, partial [Treponema endosymbiont of Eucomonympha sp.]|uniref:hypothetical protein n=1 Tax=Treponema endosymbiont of Eucomonympha sp. TaxID=1580831 RepID=UPI001EE6A180